MKHTYRPKGVCSTKIEFEIEDDVIKDVSFTGGCSGNLKGISALAKGMKASEVADKLSGMSCGLKRTSCPDQFSKAIREALEK